MAETAVAELMNRLGLWCWVTCGYFVDLAWH